MSCDPGLYCKGTDLWHDGKCAKLDGRYDMTFP